ncbi:MAG: hypothetical protein GF313_14190 [Caldithrix sp.]|nr:hypothetical protein [Caldithrix sp.]
MPKQRITFPHKLCNVTSLYLILIIFILMLWSCKKSTDPVFNSPKFQLKVKEVTSTEVWLSLKAHDAFQGNTFKLSRSDSLVLNLTLTLTDTLFLDEGLEPATTYGYKAAIFDADKIVGRSARVTATTMDTTSHDFTRNDFHFGKGLATSVFYDVSIINENQIWAVGEIHTSETDRWNEDSTKWIQPYNAVHWDGQEWELKRIKTKGCGGVVYPTIKTVFAFAEDDILFAHIDGSITFYDGSKFRNDCSLIAQLNESARKIWGVSSKDFYVVSGNGFIAHYDGNYWRRIESGTDLPIQDIWGNTVNEKSRNILTVASLVNNTPPPKLLGIRQNQLRSIYLTIYRSLHSVWFKTLNKIYLCGAGIFYRTNPEVKWSEVDNHPLIFTYRIRGSEHNNIWTVGALGFIVHYNGKTWKQISNARISGRHYYGLDVKNHLAVAVGYDQGNAIITRMKLNP